MTLGTKTTATGAQSAAFASRGRLFFVSVLALVTSGMVFGIRSDIMSDLEGFFPNSAAMLGLAVGAAFLGLAIANFVGGPCATLSACAGCWSLHP